jgi:hypothetical protein
MTWLALLLSDTGIVLFVLGYIAVKLEVSEKKTRGEEMMQVDDIAALKTGLWLIPSIFAALGVLAWICSWAEGPEDQCPLCKGTGKVAK